MSYEGKKCLVYDTRIGLINAECTFIKFGHGVKYDEGNNPIPVDIALIKLDSGKVEEVGPASITFIE